MTKRYFWLKLKDDFFNQKEIKRLRKIAGGDTYTIIYLKLLLISLKNEGKIYFDGIGDDFIDEIALEIDEKVEDTQITYNYLQQKGLVEICKDDEIYMSNIASLIGSETDTARRVRKHRQQKTLQSNNEVTPQSHLGNTEIEIEKELDIEKDIYSRAELDNTPSTPENNNPDKETSNHDNAPYKEIVGYLNEKADRDFKPSTKATKTKIKARLNEGFTLDDFKKVIDVKVAEWLNDKEYDKYLCPDTLFGPKFEKYLNQKKVKSQGYTRDYDIAIPDDLLPF